MTTPKEVEMPVYEYKCPACKFEFEKLEPINGNPEKPCPECGKAARRIISKSAFILKGPGFYVNDYKKKDSGSSANKQAKKISAPTKPVQKAAAG